MNRVTFGIAVLTALAVPGFAQDSIAPTTFSATLPVGTSTLVNKVVTIGKVSAPVDVLFLVDTTGSMTPSIDALKTQFGNVVTAIAGFTTNTAFGVAEYKDVGDTFVYRLDQAITMNQANVQTALNGLSASGGGDTPEAGLYGLQQATLAATGFRAGALRYIVWVGDAPSHDPAGPTGVTQAQAITALVGASIKVISISADSDIGLNAAGQAVAVSNGTGGSYLGEFATSDPNFDNLISNALETAIQNAVAKYTTVSLGVSPIPAGVAITITPASITGTFDRSVTRTFNFTVTFTGTFPGVYPFFINALVDGATVAKETDNITVTALAPVITKSFNPTKILPGGASQLTLVIANQNAATMPNVGVVDNLPAGMTFVSGVSNTCGGTLSHTTTSITLAGGSIAANSSCTIVVNVTSNEGIKVNTTNAVTSNFGTGNTATATLFVATPPSLTKSFGNILTLLPGGTTGLAFTLTNPNSAVTLSGLAFSDTLPAGLLVSTPNGLNGSCDGGTITAVAGTNLVTLTGATLAAGASCTFTVNVTAATFEIGQVTNTTSTVTSNEALPGAAASASIFIGNAFEVRYAANLGIGDSVVNVTNSGTSSTNAFPSQNGNLCVNVYTFSPDEQLISCCTCPVTPDALDSLSARNDLISNTLTPGVPTSIVTKVLASTGPVCNASTVGLGGNVLATGLAAWGTTIHALPVTVGSPATTYGATETPFTPSTLSIAELTRITTLCGFIQSNGSGFGICRSCRLGGLGATQ